MNIDTKSPKKDGRKGHIYVKTIRTIELGEHDEHGFFELGDYSN